MTMYKEMKKLLDLVHEMGMNKLDEIQQLPNKEDLIANSKEPNAEEYYNHLLEYYRKAEQMNTYMKLKTKGGLVPHPPAMKW